MKIVIIDNYDSFTYNLSHLVKKLGAEVTVLRNDSKMIVSAAGKAEKAVRLIMDLEEQREEKAAA